MPIVAGLQHKESEKPEQGTQKLTQDEMMGTALGQRVIGNPGTATVGYIDANGETVAVG